MDNNFHKLIQSAKQVELSSEKKGVIRARLESFIELTPISQSTPSPLRIRKISLFSITKAVSFALIILVAGGSTISYASEDTLPGDVLYTVKVNVKEPIQEKLAIGPEAKLEVKTKQIEKRLTEAQILIQKNDLSPEKHQEVEKRVEQKVEEIAEKIDELQEAGDVETILAATSKLQPVLQAHKEALQKEKEINQESVITSFTAENPEATLLMETVSVETAQLTETSEEILDLEKQTTTEIINIELSSQNSSDITNSLLATVERTLQKVEEKENRAIEILASEESSSETLSNITDKKVERAEQQIESIKNTLPSTAEVPVPTTPSEPIENITETIVILEEAVSQDTLQLTILDAEMLLVESKKLFEEGLYKESLIKAQEAAKITSMIEVQKTIQETKDSTVPTRPNTQLLDPIESNTIQLEDQASQAIQALETKLKPQE